MAGEATIGKTLLGIGGRAVARGPLAGAGPVGLAAIVALTLYDGYQVVSMMSESGEDDDGLSDAETEECVGTCVPDPNTKCGVLYKKIEELTQELAQRRAAMLADRPVSEGGLGMYDLYLRDPDAKVPDPRGIRRDLGNWQGHTDQIIEKQRSIIRNISVYRVERCSPLPPGAETQAYLPPPTYPY